MIENDTDNEPYHRGWWKFTSEGREWTCSESCTHPDHESAEKVTDREQT